MKGNWYYLPVEIRAMILEEVARQRHCGWASFAAVSREWQAVLEPRNFLTLKLRISCLEDMEHMINRSAHMVRRIWLHIELPRYTCRSCLGMESKSWSYRHNNIVKDAIVKLFSILSSWKPRDRLVLELSGYTPSDMEHKLNPRAFEPGSHFHDPKHDWHNGIQTWLTDCDIRRLFSSFFHRPPEELLQVPAVTDLVMRRRFRRHMHPAGVRRIVECLPRLQNLVYEPWRHCDMRLKATRDTGMYMEAMVKRVAIRDSEANCWVIG